MFSRDLIVCWLVVSFAHFGYYTMRTDVGYFFSYVVDESPDAYGSRGMDLASHMTYAYSALSYLFLWVLPLLVSHIGVKLAWSISLVPQGLLVGVALCTILSVDFVLLALASIADCTSFVMVVPIVVHLLGGTDGIGLYVGAIATAEVVSDFIAWQIRDTLVTTSLGFQTPVLAGGVSAVVAIVLVGIGLTVRLHSK